MKIRPTNPFTQLISWGHESANLSWGHASANLSWGHELANIIMGS